MSLRLASINQIKLLVNSSDQSPVCSFFSCTFYFFAKHVWCQQSYLLCVFAAWESREGVFVFSRVLLKWIASGSPSFSVLGPSHYPLENLCGLGKEAKCEAIAQSGISKKNPRIEVLSKSRLNLCGVLSHLNLLCVTTLPDTRRRDGQLENDSELWHQRFKRFQCLSATLKCYIRFY